MRHPLKRRLALAALLVARFQADHGNNNLQAVFDPVGQLLQQRADTLASDRMLALSFTRSVTSSIASRICCILLPG